MHGGQAMDASLELRTADALTTRAAKALVDAALTREALPDEAP